MQANAVRSLVISFIFAVSQAGAQTPQFTWAQSGGGTNDDDGRELAVAADGSVFISGRFDSDRITLGTATLTNVGSATGFGSTDGFVAKCDRSGKYQWIRQFGSPGSCLARTPAFDDSGNTYLCGYFNTNLNLSFAGTNVLSSGSFDIFLAKLSGTGDLQWLRTVGSAYSDIAIDIATGADGLFMTGFFRDTVNFGTNSVTAPSGGTTRGDFYLARYDFNGNCVWVRQGGGSGDDVGYGVAVDRSSGAVYACGYFQSGAVFSGTALPNAGSNDVFVAKYDAAGNLLWIRAAGGTGDDKAIDIAVDGSGNCYVTGYFNNTAAFGSTNLTSPGGSDIFLAKYDPTGTLAWARRCGGTGADSGEGICTDALGHCFITGSLAGTVAVGSLTSTNTASTNATAFVACFDAQGDALWVKRATGTGSSSGGGVAVDTAERLLMTGSLTDSVDFDGQTFLGNGGADYFLARIDETFPLGIRSLGQNVLVSWPTNAIGCVLQWNSGLNASSWHDSTNTPALVNAVYQVTNQAVNPLQLYRLQKP